MAPQPQKPKGDNSFSWIWGARYFFEGGLNLSTTFRGAEKGISRDKTPTFGEGDMNAEGDAR